MKWEDYKELLKCFKSPRHARRAMRLMAAKALTLAGLKKLERHRRIVKLIDQGHSDTEIAKHLGIDRKTVYRHRLIAFKRKK